MPDSVPGPQAADDESGLIIDELAERFQRFQLLQVDDEDEANRLLEEFGSHGPAERRMIQELSVAQPLAHPDRFPESHALAMHALEVLDRNGAKGVRTPAPGPLRPLANFIVGLVAQFIVRNHQKSVLEAIGRLYALRAARYTGSDPSRMKLVRARLDVDRLEPRLRRQAVGLPTFIVGGAAVTTVASGFNGTIAVATGSSQATAVAAITVFLVFLGASWCVLRGAAVARRRIRLTLDRPLRALWETIGHCGDSPKDASRQFALAAIGLTALAFLVIPLAVVAVVAT